MTAVALLCRMYLGWGKDHPGIAAGVQFLDEHGPSTGPQTRLTDAPAAQQRGFARPERDTHMYYNYYATQVMHHYGGEPWQRWNSVMRDFLVRTQAKEGHLAGSWHWSNGHHSTQKGGRLYNTAMAAMTLEVYYRFMPIYGADSVESDLNQPVEAGKK